jgi:hypothetical protein
MPDFVFIDGYLENWDQFAKGDNALIPLIKQERPQFEQQLAAALAANDRRAEARFVFYAVVQVGGFIPLSSQLGQAFHDQIGGAVPIFKSEKDGSQSYFAGDLYYWWEAHKSEFEPFPLYEKWRQGKFAQTVAIKLYESASKHHDAAGR